MIEINKIYNRDCYEAIKEIPSRSIDVIYTDIPYLYKGMNKKASADKSRIANSISNLFDENGDLSQMTDGIDYSIFDEFCRVCKYIYIYIWCSKDQIYDILNYFVKKDCNYNILVWCKTNPIPMCNGTLLSDLEYCLIIKQKGAKKFLGKYEDKSKFYVSETNQKDKMEYGHPTIKPLELVERHLRQCCEKGDVVLDPFLGSGTTALACKRLGINYIGFEKNKKYFDIAKSRIEERRINKSKDYQQIDIFDCLEERN